MLLMVHQKKSNRHLNPIIRLIVRETEIFDKVVTVDEYFFVLYIIEEIMWITLAEFQAKILNVVGSTTKDDFDPSIF